MQNSKEIHSKQFESKEEESYNGSNIYDSNTNKLIYTWSQNLNDLDIMLPVSNLVTNKNQCKILITTNDLKIELNEQNNWLTRLDGKLNYSIRNQNSYWLLEPGKCLRIFLEKTEARWWNSLMKNELKLDLNELNRTISYDELKLDEQNLIAKLVYEEYRKRINK